jgi:branched-chain amino acid transport system substrate-binding protein
VNKKVLFSTVVLFALSVPVVAAEKIKIGLIATLSGSSGIIGKHVKDGAELALQRLNGKIGGINAEFVFGDDQQKPDVGRQLAERMLKRDQVDFVMGINWSNILLSIYPVVTKANTILISVSAGPQELAGPMCNPYFFTSGWQNDGPAEAMGKHLTDKNIDEVYIMVPNYAAGRDMVAGFKRYYKGKIVGEVYTRFDQTDYQTEISQIRATNPKAVFVFYPGGFGIQFFKQYDQAGLRGKIPLYSIFSGNEVVLPAVGQAAEGNYEAGWWTPDLDNSENKRFVAEFRSKYGYMPAEYAASAFDAVMMINSGVKAVNGDLANKKGMIAAIESAQFPSLRGSLKFNNNHFPIQAYYLLKIGKDADGTFVRKVDTIIFPEHKDAYYEQCKS